MELFRELIISSFKFPTKNIQKKSIKVKEKLITDGAFFFVVPQLLFVPGFDSILSYLAGDVNGCAGRDSANSQMVGIHSTVRVNLFFCIFPLTNI